MTLHVPKELMPVARRLVAARTFTIVAVLTWLSAQGRHHLRRREVSIP